MTRPAVSIVMPTFNRLEFLPSAVQSVFAQTEKDWEFLIADDGSNRETLSYLESLTADDRVRLLRLEHSGHPGQVRNAAIAASRAPLIAFLDSDDLWEPDKLEKQLGSFRARPDCGWSYTGFVTVDSEDQPLDSEIDRPWTAHDGEIFKQTVRTSASIRLCSVLAKAELLRAVGGFDETMERSEDCDLWMRIALRSPVCVVDEPLIRVRRHRGNVFGKPGGAHIGRDYALAKLAKSLAGARRSLVVAERARNVLAMANTLTARGYRRRSALVILKGISLGWKYPWWWYRAARALVRACLGPRRSDDVSLQ